MSQEMLKLKIPGQLRSVGLQLREGLDYDEWVEVGTLLGRFGNAMCWAIGDWLFYGQWEYGSKYEQALAVTGLEPQTLRVYSSVAGRFDIDRRRDDLSFGHHRAVVSLDEGAQERWLDRASEQRLSVRALEQAIAAALRGGEREAARDLEQIRLTIPHDRVVRWQAAADRCGMSVSEWAATVLDEAAGAGT